MLDYGQLAENPVVLSTTNKEVMAMAVTEYLEKMTQGFRAYAKKKPEKVAIIINNWLRYYPGDGSQRRKVAILAGLLGADLLPAVYELLGDEFNIRGLLVASIHGFSDGIDSDEQEKAIDEVTAWMSLDGGVINHAKLKEELDKIERLGKVIA